MKTLKLGICCKDENYAHTLAYVMAGRYSRLNICCLANVEASRSSRPSELTAGFDIFLTDTAPYLYEYEPKLIILEEGPGSEPYPKQIEEYRSRGRVMSKLSSVSQLLQRIFEIYEELYGKSFFSEGAASPITYSFSSAMGGSGTSAAALTAARLLSCEGGKRVLYAGLGGSQSREWYIKQVQRAARSVDELKYILKNGMEYTISSYIARDQWGLSILCGSGNLHSDEALLQAIEKERIFDVIVADMPREAGEPAFEKKFEVINVRDERSSKAVELYKGRESREADSYLIMNRSYGNHRENGAIHIVNDPSSFVYTAEGIEIALDKAYAEGIRRLLQL